MMSRNILIAVALITLIAGFLLLKSPAPVAAVSNRQASSSSKKIEPQNTPQPDKPIQVLDIATEIIPLNSTETTADDDLATIELLLSEFNKHQGGNPVGENDEITAALLGKNQKRVAYLPAKGNFLNASGQLIDRWGTPYFFHQLSAKQMEIRSAGPDREFYTTDDVIR